MKPRVERLGVSLRVDALLLDRSEMVGLVAELSAAADDLWPVEESKHWRNDPARSDDSGTIGKGRARTRRKDQHGNGGNRR